ncbi:MAG: hypothetical protein JST59_01765 [Actinobacteria bacterium]|nr:hypothetical protein [Actinomycetota bacterium]
MHYGSSEAGHYYSYIKDPKQQWWEFNDEAINSFNPQDLAEETFGGSESFGSSEYGEPMKSEKCRNAYLLFYEREATYDHLKRPIKTMLDLNRMEGSDRPIKELALQDNSSFEFINIVFDPAFMNFLLHVLQQEAPSLSVCKMVMLYLHTVLLRARDKDDFVVPFCQRIEELLRDNKALSEWYVSQLTKPFVREFLIESNKEVRYITAGLARIAITQVDTVPDDIILSLLNFILNPNDRKHVTPIARIFV